MRPERFGQAGDSERDGVSRKPLTAFGRGLRDRRRAGQSPLIAATKRRQTMKTTPVLRLFAFAMAAVAVVSADEVTDWNKILLHALITPPAVAAPLAQRPAAIVQAAVFDAVNGIEGRYTPVHVNGSAVPGASQRAAVVQAACATLVALFPAQALKFDQLRTVSLAGIAS